MGVRGRTPEVSQWTVDVRGRMAGFVEVTNYSEAGEWTMDCEK